MAAAFNPANSDLESVTLVGALLEIAQMVNMAESAYNAANPTRQKSNLTLTIAGDERTAQIAATFPITQSLNAQGQPTFVATDYLGAGYSGFTGNASLVSDTVMSAFLEMAHKVQEKELQFPENDRPENVAIDYSSDLQSVTITANLPVTESVVAGNGGLQYNAVDYL